MAAKSKTNVQTEASFSRGGKPVSLDTKWLPFPFAVDLQPFFEVAGEGN